MLSASPGQTQLGMLIRAWGVTSTDDIDIKGMLKGFEDPNEDAVQLVRRVRGAS